MIATWIYIITIISSADWGFFGHRLINRVAVYTVPTEMIAWYKPYIDYLADHAVDPDKRRYATKHEAVRHYIDLDHWGDKSFDHVPRKWDEVLALNVELYTLAGSDTTFLIKAYPYEQWKDSLSDHKARLNLVRKFYLRQYYEDDATIPCDSVTKLFPDLICDGRSTIYIADVFSAHGIVPFHLQSMLRRLTAAFKENDLNKVLRTSAEFGHYIADACVPLHTTSNYNGQLTDQLGIHAFWESRIPELFAIDEFDMIVGQATYVNDPETYFWDIVLSSHKEVEKVLGLEKELSITFPSDKQWCFDNRLDKTVRTQCEGFARAYDQAMDHMVEDRFRLAVKSVGDLWYTAWVDAGQPVAPGRKLVSLQTEEDVELDKAVQSGKELGREHGN